MRGILSDLDPIGALWALAIGATGGALALAAGLPLPWLLGSTVAIGAASLAGIAPGGHVPRIPERLRLFLLPVLGVAIGAAFTPEVLDSLPRWWPTFAGLLIFIPLAHLLGFAAVRRMGGTDPVTAFYGTAPGGLIEAVEMGVAAGADAALLTLMQFLRLILCILFIPLGFAWMTGGAVGSAAGVSLGGDAALAGMDWLLLTVSGVIGAVLGRALKLPAGMITGPILVSSGFHLAGWVTGAPPGWLVDAVQLFIGTTLGGRFRGKSPRLLAVALRYAAVNVAIALTLAFGASALLAGAVGQPRAAVFLAYAPGGLAEMSLIALSLEIGVIYVTAHHVLRIVLAVSYARLLSGRMLGP